MRLHFRQKKDIILAVSLLGMSEKRKKVFRMRSTKMIISESALYENALAIRRAIPEQVRMMCVIKANAYGHGSVEAARAMLRAGADAFAVAIVEEAQELRRAGIRQPILILGGGNAQTICEAVAADASQAVYTPEMLRTMEAAAKVLGKRAKAHLKIDSGMSRIGVRGEKELQAMLECWKECPHVEMTGIFTHFCAAENDEEFTRLQDQRFRKAIDTVRAAGHTPIAHAAATSAMLRPEYQYDMVRAGIALYGSLGSGIQGQLRHAQKLSCSPVRIEEIEAGDTVGYGRTFAAEKKVRVMTLPIGYGDGYPRILSNRADVLVCGKRAPIIGNVCMDMIMADVTGIPEANMDSEVVLMGSQGGECITPDELAQLAGTIPYEIMLGFSTRVRCVHEE